MRTAQQINEDFRKQIRNRQKQAYFKKVRTQLQQQLRRQRQNLQFHNQEPIDRLNANNEGNLKYMIDQINSKNNRRILKMCNCIIQENIHYDLIQNLRRNVHIELTLQLLASIISKENIKLASKFIDLGIIDEVIMLSEYGSKYINICMNILGNIVYEDFQHAQMMLQARIYKHMKVLLEKIVLSQENLGKEDHDTGFTIIWAMSTLCEVKKPSDYKQQFLQILQFSLQVFKRNLYHRVILQIIFLVGFTFKEQTQNAATWVLSQILMDVTNQYQNLQQLLIVIKILSPLNINYSKIASIITLTHPIYASYGIIILEKVVLEHPYAIPRNIQWWQRLYFKLFKPESKQLYVRLLNKVKIRSEWVYSILKQIIQNQYMNVSVLNEALIYINALLSESKSPQQKKQAKFYLNNHGINLQLQRLYDHKNRDISRQSQYLLCVLNSDNF